MSFQGGAQLSLCSRTSLDHFFIMPGVFKFNMTKFRMFSYLDSVLDLAFPYLVYLVKCKVQQGSESKKIMFFFRLQEIGYTHMRIVEGVNSLLQLSGLLARMCSKVTSQDS